MNYPVEDCLFVRISDGGLIHRLQEHAAKQNVSVDQLVQTTLRKCDDLELLKNVMASGPLDPEPWGNA